MPLPHFFFSFSSFFPLLPRPRLNRIREKVVEGKATERDIFALLFSPPFLLLFSLPLLFGWLFCSFRAKGPAGEVSRDYRAYRSHTDAGFFFFFFFFFFPPFICYLLPPAERWTFRCVFFSSFSFFLPVEDDGQKGGVPFFFSPLPLFSTSRFFYVHLILRARRDTARHFRFARSFPFFPFFSFLFPSAVLVLAGVEQ